MPRSHFVSVCLLLVPSACFAPHDPIVVTAGDSEANDSSSDTTPSTSIDPTASSTISTTVSTMSTTEATTTSPSTTDETADSGSSGSETDPTGSTDDGGPLCGNNMLDGDEACDDGNDVNGDGCNNDCIESGTLLWELEVSGAYRLAVSDDDVVAVLWHDDAPHIDTFDSDGAALDSLDGPADAVWDSFDFFGNGDFAVATRDSAIEVARISAAGAVVWSSGAPGAGAFQPGTGTTDVSTTDEDDVAFGGTANAAIWGGVFDGGGAFQWSEVEEVVAPGWARGTGVACQGDGTCVVAGFTDANGNSNGGMEVFLRLLAPGGAAIWTNTHALVEANLEGGFVAIAPTGDVVVTGYDAGVFFARAYASDGEPKWTYLFDDVQPIGIASDVDGNFVIAGNDTGEGVSAMIRKLDADGNVLWTQSYDALASSVATGSAGRIFVGGSGRSGSLILAYAP